MSISIANIRTMLSWLYAKKLKILIFAECFISSLPPSPEFWLDAKSVCLFWSISPLVVSWRKSSLPFCQKSGQEGKKHPSWEFSKQRPFSITLPALCRNTFFSKFKRNNYSFSTEKKFGTSARCNSWTSFLGEKVIILFKIFT